MYSFLRGRIVEKLPTELVLEVGGVGYQIRVPLSVSAALPESGEVLLHTVFVVREDAQVLYGFDTRQARALFARLLKVTGVGPQMALAILSGGAVREIEGALRRRDAAWLTAIRGVGEKTAQRLVMELAQAYPESGAEVPAASHDAVEALLSLGYERKEAQRRVAAAAKKLGPDGPIGPLIQEAVRGRMRG